MTQSDQNNDLIGLKNHPIRPDLPQRDYGLDDQGTTSTPISQVSRPQSKINWIALIVLLGGLALAEILGLTLPGPFDNLLYDTIVVIIYSLIFGTPPRLRKK